MRKIKFSIRLFVITIGLLLFIQLPTLATTGKSTVSNLRIRKTASTESEVIEVLALGDEVEILGEEGDWYKISAKGYTGYVSKKYINSDGNNQENVNQSEENNIQENNNQEENTQSEENTAQSPNGTSQNNEQTNPENNIDDNTNNESTQNQQENTVVNKIYKVTENTQIYILPVLTSEVIGEAKIDENVTLINNAGLWVYVQTQNISGWIRIDKLSTENVNVDDSNISNENNTDNSSEENKANNSNGENTNNDEQQNGYITKTMYVKSTNINVRSQSNTSSDVVATINLNTEVKVVGEENGWYKVEVDGKSGYIRNDLLSDTKTETSSRSNEIDRTVAQNTTANGTEINSSSNTPQANSSVNTTNTANTSTTSQQTNQNTSGATQISSSSVTGSDIVSYAKQFLGYKYVYGAAGPNSFDCSGFTMYVYKHFGYSLSHSSKVQATQGKAVTGELQPGDILVFTNGGSAIGHVGIYIGNDKFIHASDSTTGVIISNLSDSWNKSKYVGARRIL